MSSVGRLILLFKTRKPEKLYDDVENKQKISRENFIFFTIALLGPSSSSAIVVDPLETILASRRSLQLNYRAIVIYGSHCKLRRWGRRAPHFSIIQWRVEEKFNFPARRRVYNFTRDNKLAFMPSTRVLLRPTFSPRFFVSRFR